MEPLKPIIPARPEPDARPNATLEGVFYIVMAPLIGALLGMALIGRSGASAGAADAGTPRAKCASEVRQ